MEETMENKFFVSMATLLVLIFSSLQTAVSHEFIVKPESFRPSNGEVVAVDVISAHVFMQSEELEPVTAVETYTISGEKRQEIPLEENAGERVLKGKYQSKSGGSHILCGHRKGMIWSKTTQGWKQGSRKNHAGVISSGMYEKFSKAILVGESNDSSYKNVVGHALEIVPVDDLQMIRAGKEIKFKVFYEGQPLATEVYATYDGFSTHPNTYSYFSNSDENGEAAVKITNNGVWMVRVQHELEEPTEDYDKKVLRAVLLFEITG
jgi:uncharacterized GH25 family protein